MVLAVAMALAKHGSVRGGCRSSRRSRASQTSENRVPLQLGLTKQGKGREGEIEKVRGKEIGGFSDNRRRLLARVAAPDVQGNGKDTVER